MLPQEKFEYLWEAWKVMYYNFQWPGSALVAFWQYCLQTRFICARLHWPWITASRKMYIASLNTSLLKNPKNRPFCLYMLLCMTTSIKRTCGPSYLKQSKIKQFSRPRDQVPRLNFLRVLCMMSLQGAHERCMMSLQGAHERFGLGTKLRINQLQKLYWGLKCCMQWLIW